jgi:hypothetical protein
MKKVFTKSVLLFAGAMAVFAFVMPSMASASSWGPIGLHTALHSADIGFTTTSPTFGRLTSSCTRSSFTANVASATNLNISTGTFGGHCTAVFSDVPGAPTCTATVASQRLLSWQATATTTSNIQIHNFHMDITVENTPGSVSCSSSAVNHARVLLTGTLTGGQWSGNAVGQRSVTFNNDEGLTAHAVSPGTHSVATARGTIAATGALTVS